MLLGHSYSKFTFSNLVMQRQIFDGFFFSKRLPNTSEKNQFVSRWCNQLAIFFFFFWCYRPNCFLVCSIPDKPWTISVIKIIGSDNPAIRIFTLKLSSHLVSGQSIESKMANNPKMHLLFHLLASSRQTHTISIQRIRLNTFSKV